MSKNPKHRIIIFSNTKTLQELKCYPCIAEKIDKDIFQLSNFVQKKNKKKLRRLLTDDTIDVTEEDEDKILLRQIFPFQTEVKNFLLKRK